MAPPRLIFFVGWVYAPWGAAATCALIAMRLLFIDQFSEHSHGLGLIGNGAICFSIGCVCKVSWGLAKLSKAAPPQR